MTDYEDYENNLAFPPTTDRTQSTTELVEKIEKLTKQLEIAKSFIFRCANDISGDWYINSAKCVLRQIEGLEK